MRWSHWLVAHVVSVLSVALVLAFLARLLRDRRAPGTTFAWLLMIVFLPYVGLPFYLVFGGRKMRARAASKPEFYGIGLPVVGSVDNSVHRVLCGAGVPPAEQANSVELLATGEAAFEALRTMISNALRSIHVTTFILGDDSVGNVLIDELAKKAKKGVEVRLLLDGLFAGRANRQHLSTLRDAGGRVERFMPLLHLPFRGRANLRNHRKLIVVDDAVALLGGMNLAEEYMGPAPLARRWKDVAVRLVGPAVSRAAEVFESDWCFATGERPRSAPPPVEGRGGALVQVVASGPDSARDSYYDALLTGFYAAGRRIWIATPYFIPDDPLARALSLAARRGVDVRIVVPARSNHWVADIAAGSYLRELKDAGAMICRYLPGMLHAKVVVVDDQFAVLGSANLDMRSLFLDYEIGLFFYSEAEIAMLSVWFDRMVPECSASLPPAGRLRSLAEDLGRLLGPLV